MKEWTFQTRLSELEKKIFKMQKTHLSLFKVISLKLVSVIGFSPLFNHLAFFNRFKRDFWEFFGDIADFPHVFGKEDDIIINITADA